jgi:hypothetical protein
MVNGPGDVGLEWDVVDWRRHEDNVRRLRQRIFTATQQGDLATVRNLQKLMLRSWSNTLTSVAGNAAQYWPTNGWDRWAGRSDRVSQGGAGGARAPREVDLATPAGEKGVHTEGG